MRRAFTHSQIIYASRAIKGDEVAQVVVAVQDEDEADSGPKRDSPDTLGHIVTKVTFAS